MDLNGILSRCQFLVRSFHQAVALRVSTGDIRDHLFGPIGRKQDGLTPQERRRKAD